MTLESVSTVPSSATSVGAFSSGLIFENSVDVAEQRDRPVDERNPRRQHRHRHAPHIGRIQHADQFHGALRPSPTLIATRRRRVRQGRTPRHLEPQAALILSGLHEQRQSKDEGGHTR